MEADDTATCTGILLNKLSDKKPKVPPGCISLLKEGIEAFGVRCLGLALLLPIVSLRFDVYLHQGLSGERHYCGAAPSIRRLQ